MKKLILIIGIVSSTSLFVSCNNPKKIYLNDSNFKSPITSTVLADSTQEPGYNPRQRAFGYYLLSLPKEEREKWASSGSFTEKEVNNLMDTIDFKNKN